MLQEITTAFAGAFCVIFLVLIFKQGPMINLMPFRSRQTLDHENLPRRMQTAETPSTVYYPRTNSDIFETAFVLRHVLVADLIPIILESAEYWTCSTRSKSELAVYNPHQCHQALIPYLSIGIQAHESKWVRKVVFTIESRDQGWSDYAQDHGTYRNSWTWFDIALVKVDQQNIVLRRRVLTNIHAGRDFTTHTIEWNYDSSDKNEREWVQGLRSGDLISIVPMVRFTGWKNKVNRARIDVYSAAVR